MHKMQIAIERLQIKAMLMPNITLAYVTTTDMA